MSDLPFDLPHLQPGWVWLVGAGPGDPGLITLLAERGLREADVVVYDALVNKAILELAAPAATLEFAGKRGGRPSASQADISERLVLHARDGKRVVRLKGGDPFIFGRGGDEGLALVRAGVPFRVVPGITAATGGLAYAGIPATHRDINSTVTFLTGHGAGGDLPGDTDWPSLARSSPVLVIYMGARFLGRIARELMAAGRPPDEPVAVISRATLPDQRVVVSTLARCQAEVAAAQLPSPTLIVVGKAVELRRRLDWLPGASAGLRDDEA